MTQTYNVADRLRGLVGQGAVTVDALHRMTGIPIHTLTAFLDDTPPGAPGLSARAPAFTGDEGLRISILAGYLTEVATITDDERLRAVYESLTIEAGLTPQNLARLIGIDVADVDGALRDPRSVPAQTKYALATKGLYLINAINQARDPRAPTPTG